MNQSALFGGLRERWGAMPRPQKILAACVAGGLLLTVAYLLFILLKPDFAPLFTGLEPKQAGKIAGELQAMKVPYRLSEQGKTIEVPREQVYDLRIKLASKGVLYEAGPGFELFDQQKFGVTDFEQQVDYQRALQEELRRTIVQLEGVEQARVHLVMPKESLFLDRQVTPSASIALKLKPLAALKPEQVQGIVDLTVGSVQGLQPENVHIIDMQGNVLTDQLALKDERARLNRLTMDQYEIKRAFEKDLELRVTRMLTQVLGPNKAVAMVTADLDFDKRKSTTTTALPGQILSQQTINKQGTGTGGAAGVPGTDTGLPGSTVPGLAGGGGGQYSEQQTTTNYQLGSRQETLEGSPGVLRRLSVAVVLDGNYDAVQLQQITGMVSAAVGAQEGRDQVNVSSMRFDTSLLEETRRAMEEVKKPQFSDLLKQWPVLAGAGASLLGLLLLGLLLVRRRRRKEAALEELARAEAPVPPAAEAPAIKAPQPPEMLKHLRQMAREKPSEVAEVLKLWLKE
ncbi:MAG: flagellar basal-body MS-ring/collar protein FliF [Bacillota bacterium]